MARQIDEIARDVDDRLEAMRVRDSERDPHGYEDDRDDDYYQDDDAEFEEWLEDAYGITADQLDDLADHDYDRALDALNDLYGLHLDGHDPQTALRIYQEQFAGDDDGLTGTNLREADRSSRRAAWLPARGSPKSRPAARACVASLT